MRRPGAGAVALTLWLVGAAGVAGALLLAPRNGDASPLADLGFVASLLILSVFLAVGVIGAVVARRRPRNAVGWLFLAIFVLIGVLVHAQEHATYALGVKPGALPAGVLAAWISTWAWYPQMGFFFIFVPLLFPTGRPPSRRWWIVGWTGGLAVAAITVQSALSERLVSNAYSVPNPVGLAGVVAEEGVVDAIAGLVFAISVVAAVASLVARFHRSRGEERQQLKWFAFATLALPLLMVLEGLHLAGVRLPEAVGDVAFAVAISLLPLSAGLAILRYRLYDIDRIVSRTVSYALLTALLAGVYVASVILLSRLLAPVGAGSELTVAAATLAAAAVFAPARRRIQHVVDRRFNRARYDAEQVVAAFRWRLRGEVALEDVVAATGSAAARAVQPARASLWLRSGGVAQ